MKNPTNKANARIHIIVAATAVWAALGCVAHADEAPQVHVRYADLNLATGAGATVLYQRIRRAANDVCGGLDSRDLTAKAAARACVDNAIKQAVAEVNSVRLTKVYEAHGGAPTAIALASR